MAKERRNGQQARHSKASTKTVRNTEKESFDRLMEATIVETS